MSIDTSGSIRGSAGGVVDISFGDGKIGSDGDSTLTSLTDGDLFAEGDINGDSNGLTFS